MLVGSLCASTTGNFIHQTIAQEILMNSRTGAYFKTLLFATAVYSLVQYFLTPALLDIAQIPMERRQVSNLWGSGLSALLMFTLFTYLAGNIQASRQQHFFLWFVLIFGNFASASFEGHFFAPELTSGSLVVDMLIQLIFSLLAAGLITALAANTSSVADIQIRLKSRRWFSWTWRLLVGSIVYLITYYLFGMIFYLLFTAPYYEAGIEGLTVPPPGLIFKIELIRAPIMVLSVVMFAFMTNYSRKQLALTCGISMFWIGGLVALVTVSHILPTPLVVAHTFEILSQNFLTGVLVGYLFWNMNNKVQS